MLSKKMLDALNEQVNFEMESAYLYLGYAAQFDAMNLSGFAGWMKVQYGEENGHAMKFYGYIYDRGGAVTFRELAKPVAKFRTPSEAFKQALEHERKVTKSINDLYALAVKENDYATQTFLQWFIKEQVEEEKSATDIVEMLKISGETGASLIMADRHVGMRKGS